MKTFFAICGWLFLSIPAWSQMRWVNVDTAFGPLPKHFHVYRSDSTLQGRPFIAYYAEVKLKRSKLDVTTAVGDGQRYTPTAYYLRSNQPLLVVNTTFFSFQTNQNLNLVMQRGHLVAFNVQAVKSKNSDSFYYPTRAAFGISHRKKADIAWTFTDSMHTKPWAFQNNPVLSKGTTAIPTIRDLNTLESYRVWHMRTAVGGGPVLLQKGKVRITNKEEQQFVKGLKDLHPRTIIGYTKRGTMIIMAIQGRFPQIAEGATLEEEALLMQQLGCVEAMNLDGGGSSCMLINGKETIKPSDKEGQRPVPAVMVVSYKY